MDVNKFREELRSRLEGQYNIAREGMGLSTEDFEVEESINPEADSDVLRIDKQIANLQKKRADAIKRASQKAQKVQAAQADMAQQGMATEDATYGLEEGDEDISAAQGKNLLKFASADKIAAAIMNMDDMELANFIENGLKQAGVQGIADNMETAGGGEPVEAEPEMPAPETPDMSVPGDETSGQEGNMKLADL